MDLANFFSKAVLGSPLKTIYRRIVGYPRYFEDPSYHFFMLPPELRLKVYDFVMRQEGGAAVYVDTVCDPSEDKSHASSAQLLRVCKTIYYEALQSLYASRLFVAHSKDEFIPFFRFITPNATQHLGHLLIERHQLPDKILNRELGNLGSAYQITLDVWPELPSLRKVTLLFGDNRFYPQGHATRSAVNFMRGLHRQRPQLGHFFFDLMELVPDRAMKWELSLQFQCFMPQFNVQGQGRMALVEEVQVNAIVDVVETRRNGKPERSWILVDSNGGRVAPLHRTYNNDVASEWNKLQEIEF